MLAELELWVPLLLVIFMFLSAVGRMAVARFPHPADLATLAIIYYTIPLAILATVIGSDGGMVFLHAAAADPGIELRCIYYALLAVICLQLGKWLGSRSKPPTAQLQFPLVARDAGKISLVLALLLGQVALGIYLFGADIFLSGYNVQSSLDTSSSGNALIYSAFELIGLSIAYAYLLRLATGRRAAVKMSALAILVLMTLAAVRGKRLEVVSALICIGLLVLGTNRFFRSLRGRMLAVGTFALLMTTVGLLRLGDDLNPLMMAFNFVAEGLFAGHTLPGVIEKLDTYQLDYEFGKRVVVGFLAMIPRFVWPSKDDLIYEGDKALDGVNPLGATSVLAEVVLQGGSIAIVIWFGCLGFLFERLYRGLQNFDADLQARRLPSSTIGYLISIAIFIPHWRDGMVISIKLALQAAIFFYALAGLSWRLPIGWNAVVRRWAA